MESTSTVSSLLSLAMSILILVGMWREFVKMGRPGWNAIVPFYNAYVLFEELYGNGWKFLTLLIPLYNIYVAIKMNIDLGKAFGKGTGFIIGLVLFPSLFHMILGFDNSQYRG